MRTDSETSDFENVRQDPSAWYCAPQAVVDDPQLTLAEKQELLAEWAQDLSDRSTAADEGMVPEVPGLIDGDVKMQARVVAAQAALAAMTLDDGALSFPQRLWRRITGADQGGEAAKVTE
jgi:hypothetical protein